MKPILLALPAAAMILAGCDASTPNQRTKNGALIGAAIGGALGANSTSDNKLERGIIGAAVGGAVGGAIGNSLDKQAEELRGDLGNNVGVVNTGSELRVTLPQDLLFSTDSTNLRPDLRADLRAVANNLNDYPNSEVIVVGHTDSTGDANYNQNLSERRAQAVSFVLRDAGVSSSRLRTIGKGESQPVASNDSSSGRAQNRRVEIIIRPYS
ncbi:outer membrane protein OmpA-like peptidoglycan-associated protein [Litoreibacter halocynthiae]|uniref:Outer membrane protein OmpA-like peptidoglycan-associated protein n=1 Tax=Litoreibacter halocynthiae TaxID=1242689 RepID=A0A4R7LG57_9RHOB|nr:OmpA family protein [Litoreibacter halocynthiae]TDT74179.1 outer membrane protein OmpA-like peptidoglycan-associated protein [Litoreibacter halocynthiae]